MGPQEAYRSYKIKFAMHGIFLAFLSAVCLIIFQNFNVAAVSMIGEKVDSTLLFSYVNTLVILAACEIIAGIVTICINRFSGIPFSEYARLLKLKSPRIVLLSSFSAGPIGTACALIGISMCGSTYANCIISMTPVATAILGTVFLKEKNGPRVFLGIAIAVIGVIIASLSPPEGVTHFYLGIAIVIITPIGYAAEEVMSTHAMDVADPRIVCPLYRMIGAALIELAVAAIVCIITGNLEWLHVIAVTAWSNPTITLFMCMTAVFMVIQYNAAYCAYAYCGATRVSAVQFTSAVWSIPIGVIMMKMGVIDYAVTGLGVIGAIIAIIGIFIVLAKPSELFNIRNV